jgi:co-chaperonin GroES (HSP10)
MIDCRTYRVTNITPLSNQVLIEVCDPPVSAGGIAFPEAYAVYIDEERRSAGQPAPIEGVVRKIGAHNGELGFGLGDRVIVRRGAGRQLNQPPRTLKLVGVDDVLAVFC